MVRIPLEWYELERAVTTPKLDRKQPTPLIYVSPEIRGKLYVATGEEQYAIEEMTLFDIVFDCESTCPTFFVIWDKQIYYANERTIWYPSPRIFD